MSPSLLRLLKNTYWGRDYRRRTPRRSTQTLPRRSLLSNFYTV